MKSTILFAFCVVLLMTMASDSFAAVSVISGAGVYGESLRLKTPISCLKYRFLDKLIIGHYLLNFFTNFKLCLDETLFYLRYKVLSR